MMWKKKIYLQLYLSTTAVLRGLLETGRFFGPTLSESARSKLKEFQDQNVNVSSKVGIDYQLKKKETSV